MADLVIKKTSTPMRALFASNSSVRMFYDTLPNKQIVGKDPLNDEWFDFYAEANFRCISHGNGAFSNHYGIEPDGKYVGGKGNGWDAQLAPPVDCTKLKGDLCKIYTLNNQNLDFYWAHEALRKRLNMIGYVIINIYKGTLEQAYIQIEQLDQRLICVQFGEESTTLWKNGAEYATKAYEWADKIQQRFPAQKFHWVFDIPILWKAKTGVDLVSKNFAESIASVRPIDTQNWCIRQYLHLFYFYELTGDLATDVQLVDEAIKTGLPQYSKAIDESVFAGCRVFLGQVSATEIGDTPEVQKSKFYLVSAYARITKFITDSLMNGGTRYIGQCYIGTNTWINKYGVKNLDTNAVALQNMLFANGRKGLQIEAPVYESIKDLVDIVGTYDENNLYLCIQNRSSLFLTLPKTITVDADETHFEFVTGKGVTCVAQSSYYGEDYLITDEIKPYSQNYFCVPQI